MAEPLSFSADTLIWHPAGGSELMPDVPLPYVQNSLVTDDVPPQALLLAGFGESLASGVASVAAFEAQGVPAATAWLSYCALPVSQKNLERIAVEAPRELALFLGRGKPLHLFTNSLGCLGINAAIEAPELFDGIGAQAPYAFSHEAFGRLPIVGAHDLTRALSVAVRLGILTPLQMRHQWKNTDVADVGRNGIMELRKLGIVPGTAMRYALSPEIGRRTLNGFVGLSRNLHPARVFVGRDDKLVTPRKARAGLKAAAIEQGVDPATADDYVDSLVQTVDGPHAPWCSPAGNEQLSHGAAWVRALPLVGANKPRLAPAG
jgi:hypothetical protein